MAFFDLPGRTALVTGATRGLGLAIVTSLAEQGARVIASDSGEGSVVPMSPLAEGLLADEAFIARRLRATPPRRAGEPHEIAGVVLMLASRADGFITGHNLVVDAGTTIGDGS